MSLVLNRRVLVVDDEADVCETFREILARPGNSNPLADAAAEAFGGPPPRRSSAAFSFEVETASSGRAGVDKAQVALAAEAPFALAFLDVRMPGWNGLETARRLRDLDPRLEIVFMTAYTDLALDDIVARLGQGVAYHCKPFVADEIQQIATKGVHDWNRLRSLEELLTLVGDLQAASHEELALFREVLTRACQLTGAETGAILTREAGAWRSATERGALQLPEARRALLGLLAEAEPPERAGAYSLFHLSSGHLLALELPAPAPREQLALLDLYLSHAQGALETIRLRARASRNERLSALGFALSAIVHDLRQPLTAATGALELIEATAPSEGTSREVCGILSRGLSDLDHYVGSLSEFARVRTPGSERLDLCELTRAVAQRTRATPALLGVEFDTPAEALFTRGDRHQLQRALLNLIENAVQAASGSSAPSVRVSLEARESWLSLRVQDNGPGVPASIRDSLFEPFATHGKRHGTGLGLAIVHQIVDAHEGRVSVVESSSSGATFELLLPLAPAE